MLRVKRMKHAMKVIVASLVLCIILIGFQNKPPRIPLARVTTTKANLEILHKGINQFRMDTGRYPTVDEGLTALIERPTDVENWEESGYLETTELPQDGWGNDFIYEFNPKSGRSFVIKSLGADGKEGGDDDNTDILSTDLIEEAVF